MSMGLHHGIGILSLGGDGDGSLSCFHPGNTEQVICPKVQLTEAQGSKVNRNGVLH